MNRFLHLLRQIAVWFSQGVGKSAHQLEKHNEKNIDFDVLLSEFIRKSSQEIHDQIEGLKKNKADLKKNERQKLERDSNVETSIEAMAKMQEIIEDETQPEEKRRKAKSDLKMTKIRVNSSLKMSEMLATSIEMRKNLIVQYEDTISENEASALQIRLELETLKLQKDVLVTAQSMSKIKLNEQYDLKKLKDIVDSEQTLFEVCKEVDSQFNVDNEDVVQSYVAPNEFDSHIDEMVKKFREGKK